ncbi:MAG TPA: RNA-binding protein S1 [Eubacteriaceae bacterium]|nr:RNA-binding protein S1 [Eubacteriaceae bacterium]
MPFEVGQIVEGTVKSITKFGAFVDLGGEVGLVHISEVADGFVKEVSDYLNINDKIKVKVISIKEGKIGLSIRQAQPKKESTKPKPTPTPTQFKKTVEPKPAHIDDKIAQFLKDSDERQQALKKSAKKSKNRCFNR